MDINTYQFIGVGRLLIAAILGGILGLERTRKRRDAGFRTYMLVSIGSAMTVLVGELMFFEYGSADTTRIAASAVSGIGFIGAGSILVSRSNRVMGLTTAAGIWVSVSVGLAAGCGYYLGAFALVAISIVITMLGERIQNHFLNHSGVVRVSMLFKGEDEALSFVEQIQERNFRISNLNLTSPIDNCVTATLHITLPHKYNHDALMEELRAMPGVIYADRY